MAGTGNTSIKSYDFYHEGTIVGNTFAQNVLTFIDTTSVVNFLSTGIIVVNDGAGNMLLSFDGSTTHGLVKPGEVLTFDWRKKKRIFLNGVGGSTPDYRVWAW